MFSNKDNMVTDISMMSKYSPLDSEQNILRCTINYYYKPSRPKEKENKAFVFNFVIFTICVRFVRNADHRFSLIRWPQVYLLKL